MKNPAFRPVHKKKEPTTNYPPDTHIAFCKRCVVRNGVWFCPTDKRGLADLKACSL